MGEILINTGVYGILFMALMNFVIVFISFRRRKLTIGDSLSLLLLVAAISLIAGAVFFRNISKMHWIYYAAILASLIGLIGLFLRLARGLIQRRS